MINYDTVYLIEKLNGLARISADKKRKRIIPFSKKSKEIFDECIKSSFPASIAFFYDDTNCVYEDGSGDKYYPVVSKAVIDEKHDNIRKCYHDIFVSISANKNEPDFVCLFPEGINHDLPVESFVIENGYWYSF